MKNLTYGTSDIRRLHIYSVQILIIEFWNTFFHFGSYVFIPILPSALLEFLSAPTPYIMGVHESYKDTLAPDLVSDTTVDKFYTLPNISRYLLKIA